MWKRRLFSNQPLQLSKLIASEWDFPANVAQAIGDQTTEPDATLLSKLQILVEECRVDEELARLACRNEGCLTETCRKCFGELQFYAA